MAEPEQLSNSPAPLWQSVVMAAVLAVALPVVYFFARDPIGLTVIFLPVYIPLAFAFIWPILVAYQGPIRRPWLPRHKAAIIMFLVSLPFWWLILRMEIKAANIREAEELRGKRESDMRAKQHEAETSAAEEALAAKGPLGFTEPLKPAEATAIAGYIYDHQYMSTEELLRLSERYQDPTVMYDLSRHKSCPEEALRVLYEKATKQAIEKGNAAPGTYGDVGDTLTHIAGHPNTPPDVLGKLLTLNSSVRAVQDVRAIAVKNPHVPKAEKIAYEKTLCGPSRQGFHYVDELRFVASDADTPPEVLECFAAEQDTRYNVATNPHTPMAVLERLTQPDVDVATRTAAQQNITKRTTEKP